jgi:hypothetical protein
MSVRSIWLQWNFDSAWVYKSTCSTCRAFLTKGFGAFLDPFNIPRHLLSQIAMSVAVQGKRSIFDCWLIHFWNYRKKKHTYRHVQAVTRNLSFLQQIAFLC